MRIDIALSGSCAIHDGPCQRRARQGPLPQALPSGLNDGDNAWQGLCVTADKLNTVSKLLALDID
jgi:hypothetical protein